MTELQYRFLDMLDEYGYDIFNLKMIRETGYFTGNEITQALRTLTKSGIITKLEQGKYIKSSFNEEYVIGNFLAPDGGIAYWSALNSHGLTEQFVNEIFVQTSKRRGQKVFGNLKYNFIKVNERKVTGYQDMGYGNHRYRMTDVEKTIVDCFDMPQYCGWYQEIIKAFNNAELNARKMVKYCKAVNNLSVVKRLAYLSDLLQKPKMNYFTKYAENVITNGYSLFEAGGDTNGIYVSKWKLIVNIPENEIKEIANS